MALHSLALGTGPTNNVKMIAATVAFLVAALVALRYASHVLRPRPSISLLLFGSLLVVHVVPMLIYLHWTGPDTLIYEAALGSVDAEVVKARILWAMACMFLSLVAGAEFAHLVAPSRWRRAQRAASRQVSRRLSSIYKANGLVRRILWITAAAMLVVILSEGQPGKIYNYFASGESEIEKILLRSTDGGTNIYIYNVLLYSVSTFLTMVLWCAHRANPGDPELRALMWVYFVLIFVGKLGTLSKAPPVIFLLQLALLSLLLKGKTFNWLSLASLLILAVAMFALIVRLTIPDIEIPNIFNFLYYRIFDIPNESLIEYFSAFPNALHHGWEYGIFGSLSRSANEVVLQNYFAVAEITRGSLLSSSNVLFVGDAWADYEWPGIIVTSTFAGFLVRMIDIYSLRRGFTDEWACLIASCAFGVFTMLSTAFSTALITGGLLLIPVISMTLIGYISSKKIDANLRASGAA